MHTPRPDHHDDHHDDEHDDVDHVLDDIDRRANQLCTVLDIIDVLSALNVHLGRASRCLHPSGYDVDEFRRVIADVEQSARRFLDVTRSVCTR